MRVTVFGATGGVGRLVVRRLLADGHEAVAYVRNPGKLALDHDRLHVVVGDLADRSAVLEAVTGSDAVVSALGPPLKRGVTGTPVTDGTRTIVAAMGEAGVRRYVGLATPSVPDPRDLPTVKGKVIPLMARTMFADALKEITGMTAVVTESDLDWTIGRITNPSDRPARGTIRAGFLGRDAVGWMMSRADIADFLVDQVTDDTYVRAAPAISN